MVEWNLGKFAEALQPLVPDAEGEAIVSTFQDLYNDELMALVRKKLGLLTEQPEDAELWLKLLDTLDSCSCDFTDFFRALTLYNQAISEGHVSEISPEKSPLSLQSSKSLSADVLLDRLVSRSASPSELVNVYKKKIRIHKLSMHPEQIDMLATMLRDRPEEVQKMFGVDVEAVREEVMGEKSKLDRLVVATTRIKQLEGTSPSVKSSSDRDALDAFCNDYFERLRVDDEAFIAKATKQAAEEGTDLEKEGRVGFSDSVSQVSFVESPQEIEARAHMMRAEVMADSNPTFVLRNWIAQDAIEAAEKHDFSKVRTVLRMLRSPYSPKYCSFSLEEAQAASATTEKAASGDLSPARSAASITQAHLECDEEEKPFVRKAPLHASGVFCTCSS